MNLTTPAVLFGAIALIMLAYTNKFIALAKLIRDVHAHRTGETEEVEICQVPILRRRLRMVKYMQGLGAASFLFCTLSMFLIFLGTETFAQILFGMSVVCLMMSLLVSLADVFESTKALDIVLKSGRHKAEQKKISEEKRSTDVDIKEMKLNRV